MAVILKASEHDVPKEYWFLTVVFALALSCVYHFTVLVYRQQKIIVAEKMDEYMRKKAEPDDANRSTWYLEFELGHHLNEKKRGLQAKEKTKKVGSG